jgi:hypothetical protein
MAIIKCLTRKSGGKAFKQLIEYMLKGQKETTKSIDYLIVCNNIQSNDIGGMVREFERNEANRRIKRNNSVVIYHEIYSFGEGDKKLITPAILKDLAEKYISLRNPNAICLAVPHFSENPHIHFMLGGVEIETGKSLRISQSEFAKFKEQLSAYEKERYPFLEHSQVDHGKSNKNRTRVKGDREYQASKRDPKLLQKEQIKVNIENGFSKSLSRADFYHRLSMDGINTYSRNGSPKGISSERRFSFASLGYDEKKLLELDIRSEGIRGMQIFRDEMEQKETHLEVENDIPYGNTQNEAERTTPENEYDETGLHQESDDYDGNDLKP